MEHATLPPLYTLVNFGILAVVGILAMRKPVRSALQARHDQWKKDLSEAEELRLKTEALLAQTEQKVASLQSEMDAIYAAARKAAETEKKEILDRAERQARKVVEDAKRLIEAERALAQKSLRKELFAEALAKAREELRASVTANEHQTFVDRFTHEETGRG